MLSVAKNTTPTKYSMGWSQDQHLFCRAIGVDRPLNALRRAFPDNDLTGELIMLVYGGDFFDHEVSNADPQLAKADEYMGWRLKSARKRNYAVRVLEGTKSHDRGQCKRWETINNLLDQPADFKYIDKVCIEHHPILGDILYVPDNWKPTTDETWEDICEVMREANLEKVDWVFIHGAFKHQLPPHLHGKVQLHDSDRFADITRKYVLVGHVHIKSQYRNIISIGSIERISHNEEEPKGTLRIDVSPEGDDIIFQENFYARIAKTLDLSNLDTKEVYDKVMDFIQTLRDDQRDDLAIRLKASRVDAAYLMLSKFITEFPDINWSFKDTDEKSNIHVVKLSKERPKEVYDLSVDSLKGMLKKRIGERITDSISDKINDLFKVMEKKKGEEN